MCSIRNEVEFDEGLQTTARHVDAGRTRTGRLFALARTSLSVAALWMTSCWCCKAFIDALSLDSSYDDAPALFAVFCLT